MATVQITGGGFSDSEGNALALGIVHFTLSSDSTDAATGVLLICSGERVSFNLDSSGNVVSGSFLWPNDLLTSVVTGNTDTFYWMSAEDENGQLVYGPNAFQIFSSPSPFVLNVLVPGNPA
jgi:hypothetical protein